MVGRWLACPHHDSLFLAHRTSALARAFISQGIDFILPTDVIVADKFAADAATQTVAVDSIPEGWMGTPP